MWLVKESITLEFGTEEATVTQNGVVEVLKHKFLNLKKMYIYLCSKEVLITHSWLFGFLEKVHPTFGFILPTGLS